MIFFSSLQPYRGPHTTHRPSLTYMIVCLGESQNFRHRMDSNANLQSPRGKSYSPHIPKRYARCGEACRQQMPPAANPFCTITWLPIGEGFSSTLSWKSSWGQYCCKWSLLMRVFYWKVAARIGEEPLKLCLLYLQLSKLKIIHLRRKICAEIMKDDRHKFA